MRYLFILLMAPLSAFGQIREGKIYYVNSYDAVVIADTTDPSGIIHEPKVNYGVFVNSTHGKWSYIRYSDDGVHEGYILNDFLSLSQSAVRRQQLIERVKKDNTLSQEEKNLIIQGEVKIGMSKKVARLSWGEPTKVNTTINASGREEQWVYRSNFDKTKYLYFENGKLVSVRF